MRLYIVTCFLFLLHTMSLACMCTYIEVGELYSNANLVVVGKVLSIEYLSKDGFLNVRPSVDETYNTIVVNRVEVIEKYKGTITRDTINILTDHSSCKYTFTMNDTFIVYAYLQVEQNVFLDNENTFNTYLCSGTSKYTIEKVLALEKVVPKLEKVEQLYPPLPEPPYSPCKRVHDYSVEKRLTNYPFSHAASVQLISFPDNTYKIFIPNGDSVATEGEAEIPVKHDTVCYSKLKEVKTLTKTQTDKLTDLLYNYGYAENPESTKTMECYSPHHGIIFLNAGGKVIEFIELCFSCNSNRTSSNKIKISSFCDGKYEMLRKLFKQAGITYKIEKP